MLRSQAPPYGLATPTFPFRGLAALAGRLPMGEPRAVAVACLMSARVAQAVLPPVKLPPAQRAARAAAASTWIAGLTLPAAARVPLISLVERSASAPAAELAESLASVVEHTRDVLDGAARRELEALVVALRAAGDGAGND